MATTAQIIAARAAAGADYAAKAQAFLDAWVELASYDGAVQATGGPKNGTTFNDRPAVLLHADFLSQAARDAMVSPNTLSPAVNTRTAAIIATWSGS